MPAAWRGAVRRHRRRHRLPEGRQGAGGERAGDHHHQVRREGEPGRCADDGRVPHLHPPHRAQGLLVLGGEVPLQLQRHDRPHRKQRLGRVPA